MKGLNRTQLKLIAITAMVIDHTAWGFVEALTPLGQLMHIIGRLTIPTMCFFIAEGFKHTSSKKRYLGRMAFFWVVTILPFYIFFHETYDFRQNIIFDLMLGLLMLMTLESKKLKKWQKVILAVCIFTVSAVIGGWVIVPILFILTFYYGKDFKTKAKWICAITITLVTFLVIATNLNQIYHFSKYDWLWYEELYLLGFMLPLLLLKRYNGEKGPNIGKYFFYFFYPAHFLVLAGIKATIAGLTVHQIYVGVHVIWLLIGLAILAVVVLAKPSKGQTAAILLVLSACIYIFGFIIEIVSVDVSGFYAGTLAQYFGECLLMLGFTMFMAEMCRREVPAFIYALEVVCGLIFMWMLLTTKENHIFYRSMGVSNDGPFPRFVLDRGVGFALFVVYMVAVCVSCLVFCVIGIIKGTGAERKRILCMACAILCPWVPNLIRELGLTGGYEIPALGIAGVIVLIAMALIRYGYFDSIALAGENALNHGKEGIMVINTKHMITYYNNRMAEMFEQISLKQNAYKNELLADIFEGRVQTIERAGRIYEMRVEALMESGYLQGYMLWVFDVTEHHNILMQIKDMAEKDGLTGVYNRNCFQSLLEEYLEEKGNGALFMMDITNFKMVNDRYGHQAGDEVLVKFGRVLLKQGENTIACRIGGDEFCLFYKEVIDAKELEVIAEKIRSDFKEEIAGTKYAEAASISIGITRTLDMVGRNFEKLYSSADKALYVAKNRSKNAYYIL